MNASLEREICRLWEMPDAVDTWFAVGRVILKMARHAHASAHGTNELTSDLLLLALIARDHSGFKPDGYKADIFN